MNELDIIRKRDFAKEHDYLCSFIRELELESTKFLVGKEFIKNLVKKEIDFGLTFTNEKVPQLVFYNIQYTFFENIEDHYGGRENDVTLGIVIDYFSDGKFNISRDIISKFGDFDYSNEKGLMKLSEEMKLEIGKMKVDFLSTLEIFITKS